MFLRLFILFIIIFIILFIWVHRIQLKKGEIKNRFKILPKYRLRILLWILALASLPIIAWYFQGWEMFYFALSFTIVCTFMLLVFYGTNGGTDSEEMKITNFYSSGTLIFLGIFWSCVIGLVSWILYIQAP